MSNKALIIAKSNKSSMLLAKTNSKQIQSKGGNSKDSYVYNTANLQSNTDKLQIKKRNSYFSPAVQRKLPIFNKCDSSITPLENKNRFQGLSQSVILNKPDEANQFMKFGFNSFSKILSQFKDLIIYANSASQYILTSKEGFEENQLDKFSLDQTINLNQICCYIDNLEHASLSLKDMISNLSITKTESTERLKMESTIDTDLKFESDKRIQKYVSLFSSCKTSVLDVMEILKKNEGTQSPDTPIKRVKFTNPKLLLSSDNVISIQLIPEDSPNIKGHEKMKTITDEDDDCLTERACKSLAVNGNSQKFQKSNTPKSNGININITEGNSKKSIESCSQEENDEVRKFTFESSRSFGQQNGSKKRKQKKAKDNSNESSQFDSSRTDKKNSAHNTNNQVSVIINITPINQKFSLKRGSFMNIPSLGTINKCQNSDEEELLTNEEVTVNRPYNICFEVNKKKDLFIRSFFNQAKLISKNLKTDNSYDDASCCNKSQLGTKICDPVVVEQIQNLKNFSKNDLYNSKRSKSVLNIQEFSEHKKVEDIKKVSKVSNLKLVKLLTQESEGVKCKKPKVTPLKIPFESKKIESTSSDSENENEQATLNKRKSNKKNTLTSAQDSLENIKFSQKHFKVNKISPSNRLKLFDTKYLGSELKNKKFGANTANSQLNVNKNKYTSICSETEVKALKSSQQATSNNPKKERCLVF